MTSRREWRWAACWAAVFVAAAWLPYLVGYLTTPANLYYTGFLSNPEDGHTYLAKIRQGWYGDWLYHLAYTPEPHQGEFLFTYYLLLGHIARWIGVSPILIFHGARTVNGFALLLALYYAVSWLLKDVARRRFAFLIIVLGSGLGWLATFVLGLTVDLWVPEGYVFYSLLSNPHFPLAIALVTLALVWSVTPWGETCVDWRRLVGVALCTAVLGIVQPFCLLTVGVVLLAYAIVRGVRDRRLPWREIASGLVFAAAGVPFGLNGYLASTRNSVFAAWSAQNQTLSPPPWDYAIGYGIVLLLAMVGIWRAIRRRRESDLFLLTWTLCTALLLYMPFSLQRRLVLGLIVPLGVLAAIGWYALPDRRRPRPVVILAAASMTHVFLVGMSVVMVLTRHEAIYMSRDERDALRWLADAAPRDALVAAAPETGLHIAAWSGQRVFYGHRFETTQAESRRQQVTMFYATGNLASLPYRPDYVFYGPREEALSTGEWRPDSRWEAVYRQGTVAIYAVPQE